MISLKVTSGPLPAGLRTSTRSVDAASAPRGEWAAGRISGGMVVARGTVMLKRRLLERTAPLIALVLVAAACSSAASPSPQASAPVASAAPAGSTALILATTTSLQDSGLLDVLVPAFEKASGYTVKTVAVGTGQALTMGQQGNADVLFVHAPTQEQAFMDAGWGCLLYTSDAADE